LGRVRTKVGRDEVETPRTGDSHCDIALSVAAAVLDHERRAPVRPMQPSQGWKKRVQEDRRRELVQRGLRFRSPGGGIQAPRNGPPNWDEHFRR